MPAPFQHVSLVKDLLRSFEATNYVRILRLITRLHFAPLCFADGGKRPVQARNPPVRVINEIPLLFRC